MVDSCVVTLTFEEILRSFSIPMEIDTCTLISHSVYLIRFFKLTSRSLCSRNCMDACQFLFLQVPLVVPVIVIG